MNTFPDYLALLGLIPKHSEIHTQLSHAHHPTTLLAQYLAHLEQTNYFSIAQNIYSHYEKQQPKKLLHNNSHPHIQKPPPDRLYQQHLSKEMVKDLNQLNFHSEEDKQCTFMPKINNLSKRISKKINLKPFNSVYQEFMPKKLTEKVKLIPVERDNKIQQLIDQMTDCNSINQTILNSNSEFPSLPESVCKLRQQLNHLFQQYKQ